MESRTAAEVMAALLAGARGVQELDLDALSAKEAMALARELEVARRHLDHGTDRVAGHLESTGKFGIDGHKTAKAALKHLGRTPGGEVHGRLQTARAWTTLPAVARAYADGLVPAASMRAVGRFCANPRIASLLDDVLGDVIAEQARTQGYDDFVSWLRELGSLIDADGADQDHERTHERRNARLWQNEADLSWWLDGNWGSLEGACLAEILARQEAVEWEADRAHAQAIHGPDATPDQFPRTPAQRRADAILAIFRRADAQAADAQPAEPLVNIVIDEETFETELARAAGDPDAAHDPERIDERVCRTTTGHRLHPADALAALLIGYVRRVVVDANSNVIDLGRRSRCFKGSSREAAFLQAALCQRSTRRCWWGHDSPRNEVDHHTSWRQHGATRPDNANIGCGYHNRLKERGYRPVKRPDGSYDLLRPDDTPITPPA